MSKSRLLWILIAAEVLLAFGTVGAEAFFGWTLPSELAEYRNSLETTAFRLFWMGFTTLSAFVAWAGLASFWRPARAIYLFAQATWIFFALISGPQVTTSVGIAFSLLNTLVSGTIIGLVYFSDLARRFERTSLGRSQPVGVHFGARQG